MKLTDYELSILEEDRREEIKLELEKAEEYKKFVEDSPDIIKSLIEEVRMSRSYSDTMDFKYKTSLENNREYVEEIKQLKKELKTTDELWKNECRYRLNAENREQSLKETLEQIRKLQDKRIFMSEMQFLEELSEITKEAKS